MPAGRSWIRRRRSLVYAIAVLVVGAGSSLGAAGALSTGTPTTPRPELQRVLDDVVGRGAAPGVTAYLVEPGATWSGSAGVADVASRAPLRPDARMRIESNSKTWLTAVVLRLVQEGKLRLDDTVDRWLPGLLRAHGREIRVYELLHDMSGLIDDNDVYRATPAELRAMLARVGDPRLRAQLEGTAALLRKNPWAQVPALLFIRLAAWQPLVAPPGTTYHHSNIGWNVAGLVAAKAGGKPLPTLYRDWIFRPLGLRNTAFSPQGPIPGQHAHGYARAVGKLVDTTSMHPGKFSDGAIVTDARDEAVFLQALMKGRLFKRSLFVDLYGAPSGSGSCPGASYGGEGAGDGYRSYVWYDGTGSHVAVVLVNVNDDRGNGRAAARAIYCSANG